MPNILDRITYSDTGMPVLLADVPNSGTVSLRKTGSRGGNERHDGTSGKFASGPKKDDKKDPPANTDPNEYARMYAAVRDAAREYDLFDEGDIREFLKGRANAPDQVDMAAFMTMVRAQRVNDLADLIDNQFRTRGSMKTGRRKVRVTAPKGFMRKALKDLSTDEVRQLENVLASRGHDESEVGEWLEQRGLKENSSSEKTSS